MGEWEKLTTTTISDYLKGVDKNIENDMKVFNLLMSPEKQEENRKRYEQEQARLAAIEAAKSPAQKLREKQAACSHVFLRSRWWTGWKCTGCGKKASTAVVNAYMDGFQKGADSVECDC